VAFTAAPRAGFAGPAPAGRHVDESLGAAEVAAMHPNLEHVILRGDGRSPLADLDADIATGLRPVLNPCNHLWFNDINRAARAQGLGVVLTGDFGNLGLTYDALDDLADLAAGGRWGQWAALASAATRSGALRWRGVMAASFEGRLPPAVSRAARRLAGTTGAPGQPSPLSPALWQEVAPAASSGHGGGVSRRLSALTRTDLALFAKGALARFGVDVRDPLTDRRLIEFCLGVPASMLVTGGQLRGLARRALSDRLPPSILDRKTRGYQAADWHERLSADRGGVNAELERMSRSPMAVRLLDMDRLRSLAAHWPAGQWERDATRDDYRSTLLRGLAVGRFVTRVARTNA
jgi:asparagine synthase (glutamine-hydrolysing)